MTEGHASPPKRERHGAHHPWSYRPHAFRWKGEQISGINFVPLATEMRAWMQRRGKLPLILPEACQSNGGYTNPFTLGGATLCLLLSRIINASHEYATTTSSDHDKFEAEVERLRLYNEVLLYSARVCEVAIKQLLHTTQIPESRYRRIGMGALLESPCPSCNRKSGKEPHLVSLVGTLAHPFHLCLEFEHCAMDHMDLVNRLRNAQATHSGSQSLNLRTAEESKSQLLKDSTEVLTGLLHMLFHVEQLENRMFDDLVEKGEEIYFVKAGGLPAEDCNFNLVPGERFVFDSNAARQSTAS